MQLRAHTWAPLKQAHAINIHDVWVTWCDYCLLVGWRIGSSRYDWTVGGACSVTREDARVGGELLFTCRRLFTSSIVSIIYEMSDKNLCP